MKYLKDKEYQLKYVDQSGETKTDKLIPQKDMSKPEVIMYLKDKDEDFFKLIDNESDFQELQDIDS